MELFHSLCDLVLVGLDIQTEHKRIFVLFCLLSSSWLTWWSGELDDGIVVKLVSPWACSFEGMSLEPQGLEPLEGR